MARRCCPTAAKLRAPSRNGWIVRCRAPRGLDSGCICCCAAGAGATEHRSGFSAGLRMTIRTNWPGPRRQRFPSRPASASNSDCTRKNNLPAHGAKRRMAAAVQDAGASTLTPQSRSVLDCASPWRSFGPDKKRACRRGGRSYNHRRRTIIPRQKRISGRPATASRRKKTVRIRRRTIIFPKNPVSLRRQTVSPRRKLFIHRQNPVIFRQKLVIHRQKLVIFSEKLVIHRAVSPEFDDLNSLQQFHFKQFTT